MAAASAVLSDSDLGEIVNRALKLGVLYHEIDQGQPCYACAHCPGFEIHFWRKVCAHCKCSKAMHGYIELSARHVGRLGIVEPQPEKPPEIERLGKTWQPPLSVSKRAAEQAAASNATSKQKVEPAAAATTRAQETTETIELLTQYSWIPDGLTAAQVQKWNATLPETKKPERGKQGEVFRLRALEKQLPRYDIELEMAKSVTAPKDQEAFTALVKLKLDSSADIGVPTVVAKVTNCFRCGGRLLPGELAVRADRIVYNGEPALYHHDTCFACEYCEEPLVDLFYFKHGENRILCGRHWQDMHRPRCAGCDESIFSSHFTLAENQNWHEEHFCCYRCDKSMVDEEYVAVNGQPYCLGCYTAQSASLCFACNKPIDAKSGKISDGQANGKSWHAQCYACVRCKTPLDGLACYPVERDLYCREDYFNFFKKLQRKSVRKTVSKIAPASPDGK